jgi:hypothetical protein
VGLTLHVIVSTFNMRALPSSQMSHRRIYRTPRKNQTTIISAGGVRIIYFWMGERASKMEADEANVAIDGTPLKALYCGGKILKNGPRGPTLRPSGRSHDEHQNVTLMVPNAQRAQLSNGTTWRYLIPV